MRCEHFELAPTSISPIAHGPTNTSLESLRRGLLESVPLGAITPGLTSRPSFRTWHPGRLLAPSSPSNHGIRSTCPHPAATSLLGSSR